jgi:hypothetical protein
MVSSTWFGMQTGLRERPRAPKLIGVVDRNMVNGHAFISYVREDSQHVDQLQRTLEAAGIPVWRDTAELWPGEDWRAKIRHAITDHTLIFIACFSRVGVARGKSYQNEEVLLAIEQLRLRPPDTRWLIPVRFDECEIPDYEIGPGRTLASIQRADLFGKQSDENAKRLVRIVLATLGIESVTAAETSAIPPWAPRFQEAGGPELEDSMSEARDLLITGVTRNTLVMSKYSKFEDLLRSGCRIRVVLLDPSSDVIVGAADRYHATISPDMVRERVRYTLHLLAELKRSTGGTISVRLTTHLLAMGIVAVDANPDARSDASALFIEYYTYQAQGEPKFVLTPQDGEWFEHFLGEAEALYASAADRPLSDSPPQS